jgi:hypothetical protein
MATWVEDNSSRSATFYRLGRRATSTYTKSYKVFGYTNDVELQVDADERIRTQLTGFRYPGTGVRLLAESYSISYLGDDAWQVTINYEKEGADDENQPDPLRRSRSFDTSGGTVHITQAEYGYVDKRGVAYSDGAPTGTNLELAPRESRFPATGPTGTVPPILFGAIGVDADSVSGVDIIVPQLQWTETYDVPSTYVTDEYIKIVSALTGTTNIGPFRTFERGEVLFLGASGSQEWDAEKGPAPWSLSFKFSASKNVEGISIGDINRISKRGHDYLWIRYEDYVDTVQSFKRPRHVYVNRVYKEADWDGLGIGGNLPPEV